MTVLHIPWIDRFPFPKMRDNVISLSGVIDEEEFRTSLLSTPKSSLLTPVVADLFTTDSFVIVPESVSWDPMAWVVTKSFEEKWGYLFY